MMKKTASSKPWRLSVTLLTVSVLGASSGCATMAHRSSTDAQYTHSTTDCNGEGHYCPWVWGDAGLLAAGIIPGVIAFAVDMNSGALHHHAPSATLASFGEQEN